MVKKQEELAALESESLSIVFLVKMGTSDPFIMPSQLNCLSIFYFRRTRYRKDDQCNAARGHGEHCRGVAEPLNRMLLLLLYPRPFSFYVASKHISFPESQILFLCRRSCYHRLSTATTTAAA